MIVLDHTVEERNSDELRRLSQEQAVLDLTANPPAIQLGSEGFELDETSPPLHQRAAVRSFDVVGASTGIVLLLPLYAVTALSVACTSRGGAVYRSVRMGQRSTQFFALKFRSMTKDAEARLDAVLDSDDLARDEYEQYHKLRNDPRVTRVGRFIRRTSLDELPQLFNVLRGQMSLVGPRPNLLTEADQFGPALDTVLRVKPGLTGLWQVSGRSNLSFDDRIMLDINYALNRTLLGDVGICLRTLKQIVSSDDNGAY